MTLGDTSRYNEKYLRWHPGDEAARARRGKVTQMMGADRFRVKGDQAGKNSRAGAVEITYGYELETV